jgi:hypothetical protein
MSYLFVFRSSPDIDHMVPLAWKLLDEGEEVHGVLSPGCTAREDHRIALLRRYPSFHLHEAWPPPRRGGRVAVALNALRGYARCTLPFALALLATRKIRVVAVEWGYGLPAGYDRLRSPAGFAAVIRSLVSSFLRAREPVQTRANFVVAARLLGLARVCLPHGLSIKHDAAPNMETVKLREDGALDYSHCNRFTAHLLNTEPMRQWFINEANGDPKVMKTLGSLRWAPEWFERNLELAPPFEWPEEAAGRLKVVFMVPKWMNMVNTETALGLVKRLQDLDFVSLAIMAHPRRKQGSADPLQADPDVDWARLSDISGVNSVSAIRACDVVIDVGSSIGIETVMQGKVLVNPTYVHELSTFFDTIAGSCVVAHSANEVVDYLRAHAEGSPHATSESALGELLQESVYGSRPEPFDVLGAHYSLVRELAANGGASRHGAVPTTEGS